MGLVTAGGRVWLPGAGRRVVGERWLWKRWRRLVAESALVWVSGSATLTDVVGDGEAGSDCGGGVPVDGVAIKVS